MTNGPKMSTETKLREKFWERYPIDELNITEWEALCDGCALCCLHKLEDEDTGDIAITDLFCRYLDLETCRCTDYSNRHINVPDCVPLNAESARAFFWLPETCAYRRLANKQTLPEWHYLISGDKSQVHDLFISARDQGVHEELVPEVEWQERVIRWVDKP